MRRVQAGESFLQEESWPSESLPWLGPAWRVSIAPTPTQPTARNLLAARTICPYDGPPIEMVTLDISMRATTR